MKFSTAAIITSTLSTAAAFSPISTTHTSSTALHANLLKNVENFSKATLLAGAIWASPTLLNNVNTDNNLIQDFVSTTRVEAKEMASGSGSRVNKDPESLLRLGLPIPKDKEVRKFQSIIEEIRQDVQTKRKSAALDGVKKSKSTIKSKGAEFQKMCREPTKCAEILSTMDSKLDPLAKEVAASQDFLNGSDQERAALDKAYGYQDELQKLLTNLEEQMVPEGYVTPVPNDYDDLVQLKGGRATVEFVLKKAGGGVFDVEGVNYDEAKMVMVIDGFTAPVTGGNFVDLVQKGFYTNMKIQRSDGFVVQTGDPDGPADGYVGTPGKAVGKGKHGERLIPCEIFVKGDKGPFYESTIEDEGRGGQATVLPFSSYGAMGWAREEYDANSGSSQFFWLLFDSDLTPAGKNVLDGRYPCFGYVVKGADFLRDIKEDDEIVSAKVLDGLEFLVQPKASE
ncbi:hypothetical protein CTEN210_01040 [Chaetoceros tenuissimus]|uniref:peptidylprolyl isomerase n=1 Tax=Chaetoceros tenuissimus TaxID=426638 RepID=A0AAD3GZC3_9STRA|nr:hypothetical protein CTEN210_01040 [Chaetoceros tenuissimus]